MSASNAQAEPSGMKVMILAAGRGERMRPLTDDCPKPLLRVDGKPLIERLLEQLIASGFRQFVINHAWLGQQLVDHLGNGSRWGARIDWSAEKTALETAGGIATAMPMLESEPFAVVNADICTDYDFTGLSAMRTRLQTEQLLGACVLIPNPAHHPSGDFAITDTGLLSNAGEPRLTFSGIAVYSRSMFDGVKAGRQAALAPMLKEGAANGQIAAVVHSGFWSDVGTPERLQATNEILKLNGNLS